MHYLAIEKYRVVALRDLLDLIPPTETPQDPMAIIRSRRSSAEK